MSETDGSSAEHLDELVSSGQISEEDYETLKDALDKSAEQRQTDKPETLMRRLTKSCSNRQIGGVCGGIAEHLDLSAWLVRLLFIIVFFGTSGLVLLVYLALYFFLPWDEPEDEPDKRLPYGFVVTLWLLWILCMGVLLEVVPLFAKFAEEFGAPLPLLVQLAISISNFFLHNSFLIVAQVMVLSLVTVLYAISPQKGAARPIIRALSLGPMLLFAVFIIGSLGLWLIGFQEPL